MSDQSTNQPGADSHPLRTSRYDRVSSWLLSLLVTIGLLVLILLITWYSLTEEDKKPPPPPGDFELLKTREIEMPTGGSQLKIPTDELRKADNKAKKNIRRDLTRLDKAATKAKQLDDRSLADADEIGGFDTGDDTRKIGGPPSDKPRRWEIRFDKTSSLDAYARQLDFFKIELAVLMPDGRVAYAFNLTKSKPDSRFADNPHETEKRYYLTWRKGGLRKADRELLSRAGIDAGDGIIIKFLSTEVEARLVALAKSRAGSKAEKIERTRFGVRPVENGFAFFVLEQTYNK